MNSKNPEFEITATVQFELTAGDRKTVTKRGATELEIHNTIRTEYPDSKNLLTLVRSASRIKPIQQ